MKRWIAWVGRLYPRAWRERYGDEFDALLEDAAADWRQLRNVAKVGLAMRFTESSDYWKMAAVLALAGGSFALAASYRQPARYISTATLRLTPVMDVGQKASEDQLREETDRRVAHMTLQFIAPGWILGVAQEPGMDLYRPERETIGALALHDEMEQNNPVQLVRKGSDLQVSFAYRDREKARELVNRLVTGLEAKNESFNFGARAASARLDLIEPANLPSHPSLRGPAIFLACGSVGGFLLGLLAVGLRRHPRAGLRVAVCTLVGMAVGGTASLAVPEQFTAQTALRVDGPKDNAANLWEQTEHSDRFCDTLQSPSLGLDAVTATAACRDPERVFAARIQSAGSASSLEIGARRPNKDQARRLASAAANAIRANSLDLGEVTLLAFPKVVGATHYRMLAIAVGALVGLLAGLRWNFIRKTALPARVAF